jgi:hypothetical protein
MKQSEIKNLSAAELQTQLSQLKKTYTDLKNAHAISPIQNPHQTAPNGPSDRFFRCVFQLLFPQARIYSMSSNRATRSCFYLNSFACITFE